MQPPSIDPLIVSEPLKSTVSIPETYTEYRDATITEARKITAVTYPDDEQLSIAVASLRDLTGIEKQVNDVEEGIRKPVNKWLKDVRLIRDTFLDSVIREKVRLTGLVNSFQTKSREAQQLRDREAKQLAEKSAKDAADAQREIARLEEERSREETFKSRSAEQMEKLENDLLDAQLRQETAALSAQNAEATLATPTNTPKGLTTRVRYDFEIVAPFMATRCKSLWIWHKDTESLKFDRSGFLKSLNAEGGHPLLPEDGQQTVTHSDHGIRIFLDTRINVRA